MSDRHRRLWRRGDRVQGTTAAARILRPIRQDAPKPMDWHDDAWRYRDTVGELRFAEMWLSNAFSRSRLFAARRPEPGAEPVPVESGPAFDLIARLAGGVGGQAALLRSFGSFMLVPGVGYLVGEPKGGAERFVVVDADDIRLGTSVDPETGRLGYELREGDGVSGWRPLAKGTVVTKVHRPHPRRRWEPDSPVRAALPILHELVLLTMHVEATAESRLAGAGVQAFPAEMEFPKGWEHFIEEYIAAIAKPIKDRGMASAKVPFPIKIPADYIEAFRNGFITYSTPFDEHSLSLREEAIQRLGNAMDMPRQVLTGEQKNHWGDWQVEESGLKMHVEPGLETICDGLTVGYLEPGLSAASEIDKAAAEALAQVEAETGGDEGEWIIWYDTSDLRVRPDRSQAVGDAYDRWEATGENLRKELGLSDAEAVDVSDPETEQRIWLKMLDNSDLATIALKKLGLIDDSDIDVVSHGGSTTIVPEGEGDELAAQQAAGKKNEEETENPGGRGSRGLPSQNGDRSAPREEPVPAAADGQLGLIAAADVPDHPPAITPGIAIVAALDGIIVRALERAGRRALNKMPRRNGELGRDQCPAVRLHTQVQVDRLMPMDALFEEAWERVPEVADRLNEDGDALVATCEAYVRMLVLTQTEHSWDGLARALGVCPCEGQVA